MLRFGTRSLLFGFLLVSLWASTFALYPGARDIRAIILLLILAMSGFRAAYSRGKRQAFWAGFFGVMLIFGSDYFRAYSPRFDWAQNVSIPLAQSAARRPRDVNELRLAFQLTIYVTLMLTIATLVGFLGAYIHNQSRSAAFKDAAKQSNRE